MEEGWIKLYNSFLDWEWYSDGKMVKLFIHILIKANYKDKRWRGILIKKGQFVTSLATLSAETGLSVKSVRTCLERLIKSGEIGKQTASKYTIITVCNYAKYQCTEDAEGQANGKQRASKGQQHKKERNIIINNYIKKENIKEKKKSFEVDPAYEKVFKLWLEYKHQRGESYKSDISLKACYNKLVRLSGGDPEKALAIVEQSMANNWAGLFQLKDENGNENNRSTYDNRDAERERLARGYSATIARRLAEDDARASKVRQP